jgi:prevent-host-death family protein
MKTISIKSARNNFAQLLDSISTSGEKVIVTKFGKPKVVILPYVESDNPKMSRKRALESTAGMWKDYDLKVRQQSRHEKIFD